MSVRILRGDCRDMLRTLAEASVHCCITSPPYWGLRDYGIPPSVWGGDPACAHEWGPETKRHRGGPQGATGDRADRDTSAQDAIGDVITGSFCRCGAWRGCLGLEPTPELFVEHMVEVFREVRRVLRPEGTLWLNLGDTYAANRGYQVPQSKHTDVGNHMPMNVADVNRVRDEKRGYREQGLPGQSDGGKNGFARRDGTHAGKHTAMTAMGPMTQPNRMPVPGLKPKDMVMIPERTVLALQADGWWVRSRIPWLKRNGMPESAVDRPTNAIEYVFLLSKSERYFYDGEAIKVAGSTDTHARYARGRSGEHKHADGGPGNQTIARSFGHMLKKPVAGWATGPGDHSAVGHAKAKNGKRKLADDGYSKQNSSFDAAMQDKPADRRRRNSDWFFETWQGLLTDEDGEPLAFVINPHPFKEAHFATFPPKLIEPMVLAGTSEYGCCGQCGAPWVRAVVVTYDNPGNRSTNGPRSDERKHIDFGSAGYDQRLERRSTTKGWLPGCECGGEEPVPVPCTLLDPFGGAGTTGLVSDRLGRNAILTELKPQYADMSEKRIHGDAPLFSVVTA